MLDVVLAGVTGVILAIVLSQPAKPAAPDKDAAVPTPEVPPSPAVRAGRAKGKWD